MTNILIRLHFVYNMQTLDRQLKDFFDFTIPSLVNQTHSEFLCFMEYDSRLSDRFNQMKSLYQFNDVRFCFDERAFILTASYVDKQGWATTDDIINLHLYSNQIYPSNMIDEFLNIQASQRITIGKSEYFYDTSDHSLYKTKVENPHPFSYRCTVDEHQRLYFLYSPSHTDVLNKHAKTLSSGELSISVLTCWPLLLNIRLSEKISAQETIAIKQKFSNLP